MNRIFALFLLAIICSGCGDPNFGYKPLNPGHEDTNAGDSSGVSAGESGSSDDSADGNQTGGIDQYTSCRPAELVINEIFYDVVGSDTSGDEFVELKGSSGACIGGYKILLTNGDDGAIYKEILLPELATIPEDGLYVVADVDSAGSTRIVDPDHLIDFDPQNGPDAVEILDYAGEIIDGVCYGNVAAKTTKTGIETCFIIAPDVESGQSVERDAMADEFKTNPTPTPSI